MTGISFQWMRGLRLSFTVCFVSFNGLQPYNYANSNLIILLLDPYKACLLEFIPFLILGLGISSTMPPAPPRSSLSTGKCFVLLAGFLLLAGCQSRSVQPDPDTRVSHKTTRSMPAYWTEHSPSPIAHRDIWERTRAGFQLQHLTTANARVSQHRQRFLNNPASLKTITKRSAPYIHYIVERLEEQNMPLELALLPVIESSYNPFAYSSARAAGLWQFIPSTGEYYNLRQTRWYDGRRDITASTNAALRYLSYLHDFFNGDWLLALAAYNAGEGTVGRAIEANQRKGLPTDYWSLPLPQETRDYVPKLLAVSQLVMSPQNYGVSLTPVPNKPHFEIVRLDRRLNLAQAARLADLDEQELYQLNPAFTQGGINKDGPKHLLIPTDKVGTLVSKLASLSEQDPIAYQDADEIPEPTLSWDIPKRPINRYSTNQQVNAVNRAIEQEIRSTQILNAVPGRRIEHVLNPIASRPSAVIVSNVVNDAGGSGKSKTHKVKGGETLHRIATTYGLDINELKRWNKLPNNNIKPGQVLSLQAPNTTTAQASKGKQASASVAPATLYRVKKGDSIQQIAKRFNVQPKTLKSWNPGSQDLKPGQMLTLYLPR